MTHWNEEGFSTNELMIMMTKTLMTARIEEEIVAAGLLKTFADVCSGAGL